MKTHKQIFLALALAATLCGSTLGAQRGKRTSGSHSPAMLGMNSRVAVGARFHPPHSLIEQWPFNDNWSYGISYALYEGLGYIELGLDYAPEGADGTGIDDVITPRLNMAFKDGYFVAGLGIGKSYVRMVEGENEWISLLYQAHLGLEIPVGNRFELGGGAYYSFKSFSDWSDFKSKDLEYGIRLGFFF